VKFVSPGSGYAFSLAPQEIDIALLHRRVMTASPIHRTAALRALREARKAMKTTVFRMQLEGANPTPAITANEPLPGKSNHFIGDNRDKWVTDVPSYGRVKFVHQILPHEGSPILLACQSRIGDPFMPGDIIEGLSQHAFEEETADEEMVRPFGTAFYFYSACCCATDACMGR
jgi:hypothetical protein